MNVRSAVMILALAGLGGCGAPQSGGGGGNDAAAAPGAAADGSGWITLFDGANLDQWQRVGNANWRIIGDTVRADTGSGYLLSDASYGNFDLRLEFWVDDTANSGVFLRCSDPRHAGAQTCYEVNIYDTRPDQKYRTGAIVNVAQPATVVHTGGRWNDYQITADGPHLKVTLNGTVTVDTEDTKYASGPIALQYGKGTVIFRNVQIRPR